MSLNKSTVLISLTLAACVSLPSLGAQNLNSPSSQLLLSATLESNHALPHLTLTLDQSLTSLPGLLLDAAALDTAQLPLTLQLGANLSVLEGDANHLATLSQTLPDLTHAEHLSQQLDSLLTLI